LTYPIGIHLGVFKFCREPLSSLVEAGSTTVGLLELLLHLLQFVLQLSSANFVVFNEFSDELTVLPRVPPTDSFPLLRIAFAIAESRRSPSRSDAAIPSSHLVPPRARHAAADIPTDSWKPENQDDIYFIVARPEWRGCDVREFHDQVAVSTLQAGCLAAA
jgi:hypothetical protein